MSQAKKFKDAKGREWLIDITIGVYLRIKEVCQIDVATFGIDRKAPEDEQKAAVERFYDFLYSASAFPPVLVCCLLDQLEKAGMTATEFYAGFNATSVRDATEAFKIALADFFQDPLKKIAFMNAIQGVTRLEAIATRRMGQATESVIRQAETELETAIDATLKKRFSATPAS